MSRAERVSERVFEFIDGFSSAMAEEYLAERDRWVTSIAAAREETVRSILRERRSTPRSRAGPTDWVTGRTRPAEWPNSGHAHSTARTGR
ncbi:hypothetical protein [Streptomyces sp. NPDC002690]